LASILVFCLDPMRKRSLLRMFGGDGCELEEVGSTDPHAVARQIARIEPTLVVVDGDVLALPNIDALFEVAQVHRAETCVLLDAAQLDDAPRITRLGAAHLLVHPLPLLGEPLTTTVRKLARGDLFGAEKYLLWGSELHTTTLTTSNERDPLVYQLSSELTRRRQSPQVVSLAMLAADELLSNAVHNAPVDEHGMHYRAELARDRGIKLDGRHQVTLRWGYDSRYVAIEVTDLFGSLTRDDVLRALVQREVKDTGAGAGMGIALTYRSCDHLVFNLAPRRRTQVIALIDVRHSPAKRVPASSFNVFVERS
jgi:DNA-binding NarL/FixJ family response regulator